MVLEIHSYYESVELEIELGIHSCCVFAVRGMVRGTHIQVFEEKVRVRYYHEHSLDLEKDHAIPIDSLASVGRCALRLKDLVVSMIEMVSVKVSVCSSGMVED